MIPAGAAALMMHNNIIHTRCGQTEPFATVFDVRHSGKILSVLEKNNFKVSHVAFFLEKMQTYYSP